MSHTFEEAFSILLKIQSAQAKNTYAQAKCIIAHMAPWFAENAPNLSDFEKNYEEIWSSFRVSQSKVKTRRGTVRKLGHDRRYLVQCLKRAQNKGWITRSFTKKDFPLKESQDEIGRALTDTEVKALLK